jgi:hypothetical protein
MNATEQTTTMVVTSPGPRAENAVKPMAAARMRRSSSME